MFKTPILFLVYNRLNYTKLSLKSILKIHPYKLYISCDGPKDKKLDFEKVNNVRNYVRNKSKHIAKVNFKFNKKNLGCKKSNLQAINWFFKNEKEGIILEDDCVARPEFYLYCKKLLKKFKDNKKIFCISGSNFQYKPIDKNSYYFSKYNHCWGWATWKNRWKYNDGNISFWKKFKNKIQWKEIHIDKIELKYWEKIFDKVYFNKIDSWAYPWTLSVWKKKGLTITPNVNLVKNIGFGDNSTHSIFQKTKIKYQNKKKFELKIMHPKNIFVNKKADMYVFKNHFKGHRYFWPYRGYDLMKKLISNPLFFLNKFIK